MARRSTSRHDLFEVRDEVVEVRGEDIVPHVIEPSYGIDRMCYAVLEQAYDEEIADGETRVVMRLSPQVAPVQVAVFPLMTRDGLERSRGRSPGHPPQIRGSWQNTMTAALSGGDTAARTRSGLPSRSPSITTRRRTVPSPSGTATA